MSAIAAIYNRDGRPVDRIALTKMAITRPERGPDGHAMEILRHTGLAHQHFWVTPEECGERQPLVDDEFVLSCDARLDNRRQLSRLLNLELADARQQSDAALIMFSYRKWGVDCLRYMLGEFAFVLWDGRKQQLFVGRDALGTRDVCYYLDDQQFLVASEVSQLLTHPRVEGVLNDNKVAAFLAFQWDKAEESFYKEIHYLAPGHGLKVSMEGVSLWRYWDVDPGLKIRYREEQEYADHYLELLSEAVRCRLRSVGPVGISLSGGLDSTSLAAVAAPMLPELVSGQKRLLSFSYVFNELHSCDEREYIKPVVEKYNLEAAYLTGDDKWPLRNLDLWPTSRDFILADPYSWLPATVRAAARESGIKLLLDGYFGDNLFGGARYWALDMMRGNRWGLLLRTIVENRSTINWREAIFESGVRQLMPDDVVRRYRRWRPRTTEANLAAVHPDLVSRSAISQRLASRGERERFRAPGQGHRYNQLMLSVNSQGISAARRLYNEQGIEPARPYYDRRLVEFVMAIPAEELGRPDYDRRLHRQAMKGRLPEAVRLRRRYTVFSPLLIKGLQIKEKETVRRILSDPLVVERKYINGDWLKKQLEQDFVLSDESMRLWFALSLELWLQRYWK